MRELKFRAWDLVAKKFYHVDIFNLHILAENCDDLQQYTGLKDKNGKEIYEGDILRSDVHIVKGLRGMAGVNSILAIIGNIHENPKLLEEKK